MPPPDEEAGAGAPREEADDDNRRRSKASGPPPKLRRDQTRSQTKSAEEATEKDAAQREPQVPKTPKAAQSRPNPKIFRAESSGVEKPSPDTPAKGGEAKKEHEKQGIERIKTTSRLLASQQSQNKGKQIERAATKLMSDDPHSPLDSDGRRSPGVAGYTSASPDEFQRVRSPADLRYASAMRGKRPMLTSQHTMGQEKEEKTEIVFNHNKEGELRLVSRELVQHKLQAVVDKFKAALMAHDGVMELLAKQQAHLRVGLAAVQESDAEFREHFTKLQEELLGNTETSKKERKKYWMVQVGLNKRINEKDNAMEEARATLRKWQDQVVDSDQRQIRQRRESANDVMQWDRDATKWRTEKITRVLQSFREAIAASAEITNRAVRGSVNVREQVTRLERLERCKVEADRPSANLRAERVAELLSTAQQDQAEAEALLAAVRGRVQVAEEDLRTTRDAHAQSLRAHQEQFQQTVMKPERNAKETKEVTKHERSAKEPKDGSIAMGMYRYERSSMIADMKEIRLTFDRKVEQTAKDSEFLGAALERFKEKVQSAEGLFGVQKEQLEQEVEGRAVLLKTWTDEREDLKQRWQDLIHNELGKRTYMLLYKAKEAKRRWEKLEREKDDQLDGINNLTVVARETMDALEKHALEAHQRELDFVSGKEELWGATLQGREWTRNIQGNIHRFFGEAHKSAEPRGPERIGGCWSSGRS
jgi:hypothetical protein